MEASGSIKDQIREYIQESAKYAGVTGLTDDASLIDAGVIDSLQLVRVVSYLEDTFGVTVADEEIVPKNFESINGMEKLVMDKQAAANGKAPQAKPAAS
jgi:acyl carrier protein